MLWNARSINNKISNLIQMLVDNCIDICCICETWLQAQNNPITSYIRESGYKIHHCNRTTREGGGVAIISKSDYVQKYSGSLQYNSFECVIQTFKTNYSSINITMMVIYRLGSVLPSVFMDEFYECLEYAKLNFKYLVICGDFNIHVNKPTDTDTIKFMNILDTFSLKQTVNSCTHNLGNTLDLLIHDPDCITINDIVVDNTDTLGSDHYFIYFKIAVPERKEITFRNFKNIDMPQFLSDISDVTNDFISGANGDFLSSVNLYSDVYRAILDRHAPLISKVVNTSNRPPWMDSEYVDARKNRRQLYKKWVREKDVEKKDEYRTNFTEQRAAVDVMAHDKRRVYCQDTIKSANNSRELFKVFNYLIDTDKKSPLPYTEDFASLASRFNNYFVEKIENIRMMFNTTSNIQREPTNFISKLESFQLVSADDIFKLIKASTIKTAASDPIPAFLLKSCVHLMVPAIVHLINMSLQSGSIDGLKESTVTPILKKAGLDCDLLSNYRPVCSGLFIDKIIQRNVAQQLFQHMTDNDLHISYQSAYKPNHSCETVLLSLINDILLNLDKGLCCVFVLLDNSAAFDLVDHDELISDMENDIGVHGTALEWFRSFLSGRTQATCVNGSISETCNMKYGVPQGSVLGPVLFNIYVRNFIKFVNEAGFTVHGYADDHQITTTFCVEFQYSALCDALPKLLNIISQWMGARFLKLNPSKTKLLIFSPQNVRNNIHIDKVYLDNGMFLDVTDKELSLGITIDSTLSFSPQIDSIIRQSYRSISDLNRIKRYLTLSDIRSLVQAVITSKIDNCNSLFYGICEYELCRLQRLQNSCARLIYGRRKYDHVSDLFAELHWLPIKQRIVFKLLLFVFKIFNGTAPHYLETCLTVIDPTQRILNVPRALTAYGDRAFSISAPRLWNALPPELRQCESINYFKAHVKHLLFSDYTQYVNNVNRYHTFLNFNY